MKFSSDKKSLKTAIDAVMNAFRDLGFEPEELNRLRLGVGEAVINAMEHGNKFRRGLFVETDVKVEPDRIVITVSDQGPGFDTGSIPMRFDKDRIWCERGRGVLLIKTFFDRVEYNEAGNKITMTKRLPGKASPPCAAPDADGRQAP